MKQPVAFFTLFFCSGIAAASLVKTSFWQVFFLALVSLFLCLLFRKKALIFYVFILCSVFFLGASSLRNYVSLPKRHISRYILPADKRLYAVKGIVDGQPVFKFNKTSFVIKAQEVQFDNLRYSCCGRVLVYVEGKKDLHYADTLIVRGNFHRPPGNPGDKHKSYKGYLYNQGVYVILHVKNDAGIIRLNKNRRLSAGEFALKLKEKARNIILRYTSAVTASILGAMLLGEQRDVPVLLYKSMVSSGTVHILVVSGFNVGIIAFIVVLLLKSIRLPRKIRFSLAIPILVIYCLMTGSSCPVVRATIMAIFFMFGCLIRREPDIYYSLSLAALFILALNPLQLFDIGFQLSFASVFSIVCLYPKIRSFLRVGSLKIFYLGYLIDGCLVSFSAWLGTMGIIAYYFRIFSPITVIANIFIVPLATLITLCGLSLIFIALICPPMAPLFACNCELLTTLLIRVNSVLMQIPGASLRL